MARSKAFNVNYQYPTDYSNEAQQKTHFMEYMDWTDVEPDQEGTDFWGPGEWEKDHPFE